MKKIPGFSGYAACIDGHLYSLNYKRTGKSKRLKPAYDGSGYLRTMLVNDAGKTETIKVHTVIAVAYHGERPEGMETNHINGIKDDNRPCNLEYLTHSANCQHSFDVGLQLPKRGELNGMHKLTAENVRDIRAIAASGGRYYGRGALALKYGVCEAHIKDIVNKRRNIWPHIQ